MKAWNVFPISSVMYGGIRPDRIEKSMAGATTVTLVRRLVREKSRDNVGRIEDVFFVAVEAATGG